MKTAVVARDIALPLEEVAEPEAALRRRLARRFGVVVESLPTPVICRRALDARRRNPQFVYAVKLALEARLAARLLAAGRVELFRPVARYRWVLRQAPSGPVPVVVGTGPAGLFAALTLAEAGWPPILLERGRRVEHRAEDVSALYAHGVLKEESNVCFGEGGAGAFSDGKLHTRVNDPRLSRFLDALVELGAEPAIRIDNRPHIGTDRLVVLLAAIRRRLAALGCVSRFDTRLERLDVEDGKVTGLGLADGERLPARRVVLATGHSARDVMASLEAAGLELEVRPFAVGFRVEHPQALIDELRYGRFAGHPSLPAADYRLTYNEDEEIAGVRRGVYSFCMCPGGVVIPTPTRQEELCINGMSHKTRAGRFANSGIVVTVGPADFASAGHEGVFAGVRFQEEVERAAYVAGGGGFTAPASRLSDFVAGVASPTVGSSAYRRGLEPADLGRLYPPAVTAALRRGLRTFDSKLRGFLTNEATLIGVETRTASPVRLGRDGQLEAHGAGGLYPCGEGLGYGGGIASAAVDGIRVADAILIAVGAERETVLDPA